MTRYAVSLIWAAGTVAGTCLFAQTPSDFTGTWRLVSSPDTQPEKTWRYDLEVGLCARARSPDARDGRDQPERLNDSITHNDIYTGRGGRATAGRTVEPGYTNLFNGSNLTGWKIGGPDSFTVENGVIVAHGASSHLFYDGSLRDHAFRNFDLKLDVLARNRSNGGVYVLTEYQAQGT